MIKDNKDIELGDISREAFILQLDFFMENKGHCNYIGVWENFLGLLNFGNF